MDRDKYGKEKKEGHAGIQERNKESDRDRDIEVMKTRRKQ